MIDELIRLSVGGRSSRQPRPYPRNYFELTSQPLEGYFSQKLIREKNCESFRNLLFNNSTQDNCDRFEIHHRARLEMASQSDAPAAGKLWGGRFTGGTDPIMVQ